MNPGRGSVQEYTGFNSPARRGVRGEYSSCILRSRAACNQGISWPGTFHAFGRITQFVHLHVQRNAVYQVNGSVGVTRDGKDDLHAAQTWPFYGIEVKDESDMYQ